jgi:hypothetical protein
MIVKVAVDPYAGLVPVGVAVLVMFAIITAFLVVSSPIAFISPLLLPILLATSRPVGFVCVSEVGHKGYHYEKAD